MAVVLPWMLISVVPVSFFYYILQKLYLRTSRELKRLESISRSPIFAHFSETMTGLSTIRAYNRLNYFVKSNAKFVDESNQVYYLQVMSQRWLAVRLDFLASSIVLIVSICAIVAAGQVSAGILGLVLTYSLYSFRLTLDS
jgi:ATP-binding cassette subfamily C (CFTR/MRP) protein 1